MIECWESGESMRRIEEINVIFECGEMRDGSCWHQAREGGLWQQTGGIVWLCAYLYVSMQSNFCNSSSGRLYGELHHSI